MIGYLKRRLSEFINKDSFDHNQKHVDPFKFHYPYIFLARLFNVVDDEDRPKTRHCYGIYVAVMATLAGSICCFSTIHYIQVFQFHLITEGSTYFVIMVYKLGIVICTFTQKKYYFHMMRALREDFEYITTRGSKYRKDYFENQKIIYKAYVLAGGFIGSIGTSIASCAIAALIYNIIYLDGKSRPLPYPFWMFKWDVHETPTFEILFGCSMSFTVSHASNYIFMIQTQIIWVGQITCKADIISWRIRDLLVDVKPAKNKEEERYYSLLISHRMREILAMHNDMLSLSESYAAIFKKFLLFEQKVASPVICLTAYCAAEKIDAGQFPGVLLLLCSSIVLLMSIPSYLCTLLGEKMKLVSDACWDMPFWNAGPVLRPYALLIMQRSMRPLPMAAAGFEDVSLQTYANMLTRAYSCFNMLRQANFEFSQ